MNIERFVNLTPEKNSNGNQYTSSTRRGIAAMIDAGIVLFIRVVVAQILGILLVNNAIKDFMNEFQNKFGTEFVKNNPDHIDFVLHHRIFIICLLFYATVIFIGALYHALLNSSSWQATIGKRILGITVEKTNGSQISFGLGLAHYFLSVLPFVFVMYLIVFQVSHNLTFYGAITASSFNIFFGVLFILWTQIHSFTKKKNTAYDLICKTTLVNKKIATKFPWSKVEIRNFL